jgi:ADP-ribose pyrophosphatase YjhB (NUDIX family)
MRLKETSLVKAIIASGPVIIQGRKMLVILDDKDNFLKFPGGKIFYGKSLAETCKIKAKQEICVGIKIIKELEPLILWIKPQTGEKIPILLIHYLAKIKANQKPKPGKHTKQIFWINRKTKTGYKLAPNVKYFLKKLRL